MDKPRAPFKARVATPSSETPTVKQLVAGRLALLPSWVILTQLFIGLGWLRAVGEKVINPNWWTGDVIDDFLLSHSELTLSWYQPFIDVVVSPGATLIALVVVVGQLVAGLSLVSGRHLGVGLGLGMALNLHFLAAGAVTPSAFYLLAQGALVLWMAERQPSARTSARLEVAAAVAIFLAAMSLPSISTLHPAQVIEDPAVMYVFGGTLTTMACLLAQSSEDRLLSLPTHQ